MTTSHCCTVVGLRRCGGRLSKGAIPVPCRPWLPPTNAAPELEASASSSLKHYSSPEATCGSGLATHPPPPWGSTHACQCGRGLFPLPGCSGASCDLGLSLLPVLKRKPASCQVTPPSMLLAQGGSWSWDCREIGACLGCITEDAGVTKSLVLLCTANPCLPKAV